MSHILVLGLGNTLLSDDGAGIRVLEAIEAAMGAAGAVPARAGFFAADTPWTSESRWNWGGHDLRLVSASVGGFAFIDYLTGADAALIIDAVPAAWVARAFQPPARPGEGGGGRGAADVDGAPGATNRVEPARDPGDIALTGLNTFPPSARLASGHEMNLATAVAYARRLGLPMPSRVQVLGILAADVETFSEECTPAVTAAIPKAAAAALDILRRWCRSSTTGEGCDTFENSCTDHGH